MRIAILTAGSSTHTKGIMNFVCEEARQINKRTNSRLSCDVYMIREKRSLLLELFLNSLKKSKKSIPAPDEGKPIFEVDGVLFHNLWIRDSIISFAIRTRVTHKPISRKNVRSLLDILKEYDYIITHNTISQYVGCKLWDGYHIPFGAFWHGTELTTSTFINKYSYAITKKILENAHDNFFVSNALKGIAESITRVHNAQVIYTGPSDIFFKYSEGKKKALRNQFGIKDGEVVVAYAGNLIPMKNVLQLPAIFAAVKEKCPEKKFKFWIIGNGELEEDLRMRLEQIGVDYTIHGKVIPNKMPDYMNCIDNLLLISQKEGLGLVCLEALRCGANVFGSKIGGIPEVVGDNYCAELNESFVDNLSNIIVNSVRHEEKRTYPEDIFSWKTAIDIILERIGA